jgi:hypothetical protein
MVGKRLRCDRGVQAVLIARVRRCGRREPVALDATTPRAAVRRRGQPSVAGRRGGDHSDRERAASAANETRERAWTTPPAIGLWRAPSWSAWCSAVHACSDAHRHRPRGGPAAARASRGGENDAHRPGKSADFGERGS